jgi:pimeloyl-ACP methyl ester carboxylesterase
VNRQQTRYAAGLAYDREGDGPPLLLVHGLGSSRAVWDPVRPRLARTYTTYAIDLPGHGESPPLAPPATDVRQQLPDASPRVLAARVAALVDELRDELGTERPHVVGHSLGGWVVLELAADGQAASVTAMAPAGLWLVPHRRRSPLMVLNRVLATRTAGIAPFVLRTSAGRHLGFWTASYAPSALPVEVVLDAAAAVAGSSGYEAAHDGTLGRRFERAGYVPADVPVTIAFGDVDRILPSASQERVLAPAHARWEVLRRCGHVPMWDRPNAAVRLVRETARDVVQAPEAP